MKFNSIANIFPMMSDSEFDDLRTDIKSNGLIEPIWTYHGEIIDGRNRYKACVEAGIEPRYKECECDNLLSFVISLNLKRRHLNESQRGMVAANIANMPRGYRTDLEPRANLPEVNSSAEAAAMMNVSNRTVKSAKKVKESGTNTLIEAVQNGKIAVSQAAQLSEATPEYQEQVVKKVYEGLKITEAKRQIKKETVKKDHPLPSDKYKVLYADPPWSYGNDMGAAMPGTTGARDHYPCMSIQELCAMPVKDLMEDNAVMFLWVTSPLLEECFPVIHDWGFKYKTSFVWDKVAHNMGHYNSVRHEFLLVCTRGSCTPDVSKLFDSVQTIEKTRKHSEKPEEFRTIIETLYPNGKKLELFARKQVQGWDVWGNESE